LSFGKLERFVLLTVVLNLEGWTSNSMGLQCPIISGALAARQAVVDLGGGEQRQN
jgi:hypothetical protein